MLESLRLLLEEKILPMAADAHADPFLGIWHNKDFLTMLAHQGGMLIKAFTCLANVDPDMKFYTMSLKEWTIFVQKLNIAGQGFAQRDTKNTFWRAQGAFAPEFGTMVAMKEREEFLEKLHATDEQEAADHGNTQEMNYLEFVEGVRFRSHFFTHSAVVVASFWRRFGFACAHVGAFLPPPGRAGCVPVVRQHAAGGVAGDDQLEVGGDDDGAQDAVGVCGPAH